MFNSEAEMVNAAQTPLQEKLGKDSSEILKEFPYGGGRTDMVVTKISPTYLDRRIDSLGLETPILERLRLKIFVQLHRRGVLTKRYLLDDLCRRRSKAHSALEWLISTGFIREFEDKIKTVRNLRRHITTSHAIEFKLKDWQMALKQAFRAKTYANYQYVALDSNYIDPARTNEDKFEKYNIGLISVEDDGTISIEYESDRQTPSTPLSVWALNECTLSPGKV